MGCQQSAEVKGKSSYQFMYNLASVNTLSPNSVVPQVRSMDEVAIVLPPADTTPWNIVETKNCDCEVAPHPSFVADKVLKLSNLNTVGEVATVRVTNNDPNVPEELRNASFGVFVQAAADFHHVLQLASLIGVDSTLVEVRKVDKVTVVLPKTSHPWVLTKEENCDAVLADHTTDEEGGQKAIVFTNFKTAKKDARVTVANADPALSEEERTPFFKFYVKA